MVECAIKIYIFCFKKNTPRHKPTQTNKKQKKIKNKREKQKKPKK